jgi:hypothetical protein
VLIRHKKLGFLKRHILRRKTLKTILHPQPIYQNFGHFMFFGNLPSKKEGPMRFPMRVRVKL